MRNRRIISIVLGIVFIGLPANALAYDDDTHFWFTYYLARKAGYPKLQATQIASATVSVDYDKHTHPVLPRPSSICDLVNPRKYHQRVRTDLHALVDKQERTNYPKDATKAALLWDLEPETDSTFLTKMDESVDRSQDRLWRLTMRSIPNPGVFLHYVQDRYPHRGFTGLVGHAGYFYVDHLGRDIEAAERMARETIAYLIEFKDTYLSGSRIARSRLEVLRDANRLSIDDWKEIDAVIKHLASVNPSKEVPEPNGVFEKRKKIGDVGGITKLKLIQEALKIIERYDVRPSPEAAKIVVLRELNEEDSPPEAWIYDLKSNGTPAKRESKCKLTIKTVDLRGFFSDKLKCGSERIPFAL